MGEPFQEWEIGRTGTETLAPQLIGHILHALSVSGSARDLGLPHCVDKQPEQGVRCRPDTACCTTMYVAAVSCTT